MGPSGPRQEEEQVDFVAAGGVPVFIRHVLEPAEVRSPREVEQHVDATERSYRQVDELCAVVRIAETTWLQRHHLAVRLAYEPDGLFRGLHRYVASDDQRALSSEGQGGGAAHASARARDDADLVGQPPRH